MSKYHAQPVVVDGFRFDSKAEAARYAELKLLQEAGRISGLTVHPHFELVPRGEDRWSGTKFGSTRYEADFFYIENGHPVAEDVKGVETAVFRLKRRLFWLHYPDIELRVLKAK